MHEIALDGTPDGKLRVPPLMIVYSGFYRLFSAVC